MNYSEIMGHPSKISQNPDLFLPTHSDQGYKNWRIYLGEKKGGGLASKRDRKRLFEQMDGVYVCWSQKSLLSAKTAMFFPLTTKTFPTKIHNF